MMQSIVHKTFEEIPTAKDISTMLSEEDEIVSLNIVRFDQHENNEWYGYGSEQYRYRVYLVLNTKSDNKVDAIEL